MLRAKHLSTLSQSARTFFLNGPRCSAADGSSCTCPEDETCISRRPLGANVQHSRGSVSLLSKASVGVGSPTLVDPGKGVNALRPNNSSVSHATCSTSRAAPVVSYVEDSDAKEIVCSSPPIADQFVKAGMAAVGLLSDLVNYRIPMTARSSMLAPFSNSMVDRAKPISSIRSVNVKASKKYKVRVAPSGEPGSGSNYTSVSCDAKGRAHKSVSSTTKGSGNESNNISSNFVKTHEVAHETKRSVPQQSRSFQNRAVRNAQQPEGRLSGDKSGGYVKSTRQAKAIPRAALPARQFISASSVVESVSGILHQFNCSTVMEEALENLNCLPDAFQANQILKQLQDYRVALGFFNWLKRQLGFKHDGHTYTTMVGILGRARQFGAINKLLVEMMNDGCQPNVVTYNHLIHSYGKANYLNEAIDVFNQMHKLGCEPDRLTYCTLIDIHAKAGYLDVAMDMYQRMQQAGLSPRYIHLQRNNQLSWKSWPLGSGSQAVL